MQTQPLDPPNDPAGSRMATQMATEIAEQPAAVRATLERFDRQRADIAALAAGARSVVFMARGSSDNAATYGRYLTETHAHLPAALGAPSVATLYRSRLDLDGSLVVCVSQSGATQEIVETLAWAKECRARTIAITNVADSPLALAADLALVTRAGAELAVPATKTYLTQVAAIASLVAAIAPSADLDAALAATPDQIRATIDSIDDAALTAAADILVAGDRTASVGRGLTYGTALELGLKLEETCLRPVRALSYADLRHGPIAAIGSDVATLVVAPTSGPTLTGLVDLARQLGALGGPTIAVGGDDALGSVCTTRLAIADVDERVAPLLLAVPGQILIEQVARRLGVDPDNPRGLNKVTQTESTSAR